MAKMSGLPEPTFIEVEDLTYNTRRFWNFWLKCLAFQGGDYYQLTRAMPVDQEHGPWTFKTQEDVLKAFDFDLLSVKEGVVLDADEDDTDN